MEILFKILLIIHIICGTVGLFVGSYVLFAKKGDTVHKKTGSIFFYAMVINGFVSLVLAKLHPNIFLFIVGIFSLYLLLTGKRYLQKKIVAQVQVMDWILLGFMLIFGIGFICLGIFYILNSANFGIVPIVFGLLGLRFVFNDYKNFRGQSTIKNYWLTSHIQRMIGSYIAAATAFLVVNNTVLPNVVAWLLPTAILVPLIFKWSNKYKKETPSVNLL